MPTQQQRTRFKVINYYNSFRRACVLQTQRRLRKNHNVSTADRTIIPRAYG